MLNWLELGTGIGIDAYRVASWVRRHDVVIVPGMGVLETTLPLRPWETPYLMFLVGATGRAFGTRVALVSVGASAIKKQASRRLVLAAARLANYRSFRNAASKAALQEMGVDTSADRVYPDLAFSLPAVPTLEPAPAAVGVGVMDYEGSNDDRARSEQIRSSYIRGMTDFSLWLIDQGRAVRFLAGDQTDAGVIREVMARIRVVRPGMQPAAMIFEAANTLGDLMRQISSVDSVVASRFHTVLCALKLAKPTLAVGYATKFDALMAEMGVSEFSAWPEPSTVASWCGRSQRSRQPSEIGLKRFARRARPTRHC